MKRPSIRRQLIFGSLILTASILGFSKITLYREIEHSMRHELDGQLLQSVNFLSKSVELEAGGILYEWKEALESSGGLGLEGLFQFWDLRSGSTIRSPDLKNDELEFFHGKLHEPLFRDLVLKDGSKARAIGLLHYPFTNSYGIEEMKRRGRILRIEDYPQVVVYARETGEIEEKLSETRWNLVKSGVFTLVGIWLVIFLIIHRSLQPMDRLAAALVKRSTEVGTPLPSLPKDLPVELIPLASAFNSTLERVETARMHEKDFAFSAAHQLRTPISGIHAILELAHSKPRDGEDLHARIGSALKVTREMKNTVNALMRLARLRGGMEEPRVGLVRPGEVVREILETEERAASLPFVRETAGLDSSFELQSDEGMFRMLVSNLIENAFRYTPEGGTIRVEMSVAERFTLDVSNSCEDFPQEDAERIFRPFQRGRKVSVNSPGTGLGLTLAKEIAVRLGGNLELMREDAMLTFRVTLPC